MPTKNLFTKSKQPILSILDHMLHTDMGMYLDFKSDENGKPTGCSGLDGEDKWRINSRDQIVRILKEGFGSSPLYQLLPLGAETLFY